MHIGKTISRQLSNRRNILCMGECIKVYSLGGESCTKGHLPPPQAFKENYYFFQQTDLTLGLLGRYSDSNCLLKLKSGKLFYSAA